MSKLGHIHWVTGRLHKSHQILQEAFTFLRQQGKQEYFPVSDLYCRLSHLFYEWNDIESAQKMSSESLRIARLTEKPFYMAGSLNAQGRLLTGQGDWDGAQNALEEAANLIRKSVCWPQLVWENET